MSTKARRMLLGTILNSTGLHLASWRHPSVDPAKFGLADYAGMASLAEGAKLDFLFFADSLAMMYANAPEVLRRLAPLNDYDPINVLCALAATTKDIGLIASATTTYNEPFHIARQFSSLDHLSAGRAGWNVITSVNPEEAHNFAHLESIGIEKRYLRALETVEVAQKLWDSWAENAVIADKEQALFYDPANVSAVNHQGEFFKVKGPLTVRRSPQQYPVIVQSGSSDTGRTVGATIADIIFTAQQSLPEAQAFYRDIKARVASAGRNPDQVSVIPGFVPFVGRTTEEAKEKFEQLQSLIHPDVGLSLLSSILGDFDLSGLPLDGPVPELPENSEAHSRRDMLLAMARREGLTIRQLYMKVAAGARGHWTVVGSVSDIADVLEEWFRNEGADGFTIIPPYLPVGLQDIMTLLVPELQRRGLVQTEYEPGTLRQKLGIARNDAKVATADVSRKSA